MLEHDGFLAPAPWAEHFIDAIYPVIDVKLTPEQRRRIKAFQKRQEKLRTAGLLDDENQPIQATDCPKYIEITEEFWQRCELTRGHDGPHRATFERTADSKGGKNQ